VGVNGLPVLRSGRMNGRFGWTMTALAGLLVACAAPQTQSGPGAAPRSTSRERPLVVAGPRCSDGACKCRRVDDRGETAEERSGPDDPEGTPAAGTKRFELRTGRGLDPVTITVDKVGTLHKQLELPEPSCGYVDLAPGTYHVWLHARPTSAAAGMEPALFVAEHGARTGSWYRTLRLHCGGNGPCSESDMERWIAEAGKVARGLHDPCGSTKIEALHWKGRRVDEPGTDRLAELEVDFVLHVYPFEPRFPSGTARCKGLAPEPATP